MSKKPNRNRGSHPPIVLAEESAGALSLPASLPRGPEPPPPPPPRAEAPPPFAPPARAATPGQTLARALRNRWPVVLGIGVSITLLAWGIAAAQPKRYRAVAIAAVTPSAQQLSPSELIRGVDTLDRRVVVASLAALASAPKTERGAGLGDGDEIRAAVLPNTNLFRIEVESTDPARAAAVANRVPAMLSGQARAMYSVYGVTLVSDATTPRQPVLPRVSRAVITGLFTGILLGLTTAWLLEQRRPSSAA